MSDNASYSWDRAIGRRLARNFLEAPAPAGQLTAVASAVCGLQAQILASAELALGLRVRGATVGDVRTALWTSRQLVKTYGPRTTLHMLAADDVPLYMAALRAREALLPEPWHAKLKVTPEQAQTMLEAIAAALDGRALTREELAQDVADRVGAWAREPLASTWGEFLSPAAFRGWLCFGPSQGSKATFVRADQWIANWRDVEPEAAIREVLVRFAATYGPITARDFAHWFWLTPTSAQALIDTHADALTRVSVAGGYAWLPAGSDEPAPTRRHETLRLLPQYDCYVLGSHPRESIVPDAARQRIAGHGRGRFEGAVGLPVLLLNGVVAGMWERRERATEIVLRVEAFETLTVDQRDLLEVEVERIGAFFEKRAVLRLGRLTAAQPRKPAAE
jgi:hypothetical protein